MTHTFSPNGQHNVFATLNGTTGLVDVLVVDPRVETKYEASLPLERYNAVIDYLKANDHRYVINDLNQRFK